MKNGKKEELIN